MTDSERLDALKEMKASSGDILSGAYRFNEWTGRVSGLLGFDSIARHKFDALCDYIHNEQEGGRWQLYENVLQAENKIQAILGRAISDLEINRPVFSLNIPEGFSIPDPVVIPDAAGFGYTELEISRATDSSEQPLKTHNLTNEEGALWFWHHCHYIVKWKLVGMAVTAAGSLLWLGWMANEQEVLRDIGRAFQKFSNPAANAPDGQADPNSVPPKP